MKVVVSKSIEDNRRQVVRGVERSVVRDGFRSAAFGMDYNPTKIDNSTWDRMMQDAQVRASLSVITLSCLAKGYEFQYPGKEKELGSQMIDYLVTAFDRVNGSTNNIGGMHPIFQEMLQNSLGTGYSVSEIVYDPPDDDDKIYMKKWKVLPKSTLKNCFRISDFGDLEMVIQNRDFSLGEVDFSGNDLNRLVVWSHNKDSGNWYGESELKYVYKNWYSKQYYLQFWGIALERYATPWLVAYIEHDDDIGAFTEALDKSRPDTNFVTCQGNKIEVMESSGNGMLVYERAIKYHDEQIMRGMLVPTLVMGIEETGARSLGDTHFDLFSWRIQDIQKELASVVQIQINRLIDINFENVDLYPKIVFQPLITKDRKMLGDMLDKLIISGVISPKENWIRPFLGLPPPDQAAIEKEQEEEPPIVEDEEEEEKLVKHSVKKYEKPLTIVEDFDYVEKMMDDGEKEMNNIFSVQQADILKIYKKALDIERLVSDEDYDWVNDIPVDSEDTEENLTNLLMITYMGTNDYMQDLFFGVGLGAIGEVDEELLRDYAEALAKSTYHSYYDPLRAQMNNRIILGMARGETNKDIYKALQDISSDYTKRQAETHARTVISDITNRSRLDYYQKNKDFVRGLRYSIIKDDRTTLFCLSMENKVFSIDDPIINYITPPNHFSCRSLWAPVTILDQDIPLDGELGEYLPDKGFGKEELERIE